MIMKRISPIIVPLDGSQASVAALGAARALASILSCELHVIHVADCDFLEDELLRLLDVEEKFEHIPHCLKGEVVEAILSLAADIGACMIVMSSHGQTYDTRDIMGSKTRDLAQRSDLPIMVIRPDMKRLPDAGWKPARLLVPLDGSPLPTAVVDQVFEMAIRMGLEVYVLHVAVFGRGRPREAGSFTSPRYVDQPHYDWPAWAEEFTKRFTARRPPTVKLSLFHERGEPVEIALDFAAVKEVDIIALNWHGRMNKKHAATVRGILRRSESPVLLMRVAD